MNRTRRAHQIGVVACHHCTLVCQDDSATLAAGCPRCGGALHRRRRDSIARTWALLLAGLFCYVPANLLPVIRTGLMGTVTDSTIMSGVIQFWHHRSYGIAAVIFIASVLVPCAKFIVLALLLVSVRRTNGRGRRQRARLYRLVEQIGYWSMLDVLVVAMVAALVKFGALSDVEPRVGIFFFGMAVILTMLAAQNFDPRLIWDGDKQ